VSGGGRKIPQRGLGSFCCGKKSIILPKFLAKRPHKAGGGLKAGARSGMHPAAFIREGSQGIRLAVSVTGGGFTGFSAEGPGTWQPVNLSL